MTLTRPQRFALTSLKSMGLKAAFVAYAFSAAALANPSDGQLLYNESCAKCHHTPYQTLGWAELTNRFELRHMVGACSDYFQLDWDRQDVNDTVEYLNKEFFFFE